MSEERQRTETRHSALPRRRLTAAERLPQILEAALEEFAENGFGGASMAGAAARAGVAKGLIYHYFPGKAELFAAVVRSCVQPLFDEAERLVADHSGSPTALLRRLVELGYARIAAEEREALMFKLLIAEADRFPELAAFYRTEVLSRALALAGAVVRAGVAVGEFRPDAADEPGLAAVLLAPITMAAVWRLMLGPAEAPSLDAMCRAHTALVVNGLRSPQRQPS
ncbi:TetR/AcrR family transcriptional regulator [Muricoccus radiodurans]|uniref:TetR/AcrR family transcriptional regulator n=1 Tax=Muricoccus radiodurans TaxID=2231721 RepID=UPI003CED1CFD